VESDLLNTFNNMFLDPWKIKNKWINSIRFTSFMNFKITHISLSIKRETIVAS
jgi:hypothetical protein